MMWLNQKRTWKRGTCLLISNFLKTYDVVSDHALLILNLYGKS